MRSFVSRLGHLALALLLGGCVVGPQFKTPVPPTGADAPLVSLDPKLETPTTPPDAWWRLYDDPQLDRLVQEALAANADLRSAQANLTSARALLQGARAGRYPTTTVQSGSVYGRDPGTDEILEIVGAGPQTIWVFDDLLDGAYEADLFGRVRRSVQAARADAEAAAAARDAVKVTVAAETARAYAQVCALGEQIAVARHSLDVVAHEAETTLQRQQAGAGSEFDLVRAQGLVAQVRAAIPPLEGQRRAALFQLTALLGRTPSKAPSEVLTCVAPPTLTAPIPVGDGAALLKRRPDVRQADRRVAAATARIGVATADLYPRVTLSAFYGGVASDISAVPTNTGLAWGVGPKISWSFPNQAAPRARIRKAKAGAQAALAGFDSAVLTALKETETALSTYAAELERRTALAEAQAKARRAFDMAHGQYIAGALSNLDLLTAEQSLVSTDAAVAASDAALVQDQISLFKALGGGWVVTGT